MNTRGPTPNQIQKQVQALQPISQRELAVQTAIEFGNTQKSLGLSLSVRDKNFHKISGKFENMTNLLNNPEFISKLSQEFYISTNNDITWFKSKLRNGKLSDISFLLTLRINWIIMINKVHYSYDFIVVGYSPGDKGTGLVHAQKGEEYVDTRKHFQGLSGHCLVQADDGNAAHWP